MQDLGKSEVNGFIGIKYIGKSTSWIDQRTLINVPAKKIS